MGNDKRHDVGQDLIDEHTPHAKGDFDDIVEHAYQIAITEMLIKKELKMRSNDNGER